MPISTKNRRRKRDPNIQKLQYLRKRLSKLMHSIKEKSGDGFLKYTMEEALQRQKLQKEIEALKKEIGIPTLLKYHNMHVIK